MKTSDLAWSHEVFQNTVGLDHDMLAVIDLYLRTTNRIDERQVG